MAVTTNSARLRGSPPRGLSVDTLDEESRSIIDIFERDSRVDFERREARGASVRVNRRSTVDEGREGSVRQVRTDDREGSMRQARTDDREGSDGRPASVRVNRRSTVDEGREGNVKLGKTEVAAEVLAPSRPRGGDKAMSQRRTGGTDGGGSNFPVVEREIGDKEKERQRQIETELAKERERESLMNIENLNPSVRDDAVESAMDALFPYMKISAFSSPRYKPNLSSKVSAKLSKKPSYDSDASRRSSSRRSSSAELLFEHSIDGTEVDVLGNY